MLNVLDRLGETLAVFAARGTKRDLPDFCELETAVNPSILATRSNDLVSFIHISGVTHIPGDGEMARLYDNLHHDLRAFMKDPAHTIVDCHTTDPGRTRRAIQHALAPSYGVSRRMGLDIADILDERTDRLMSYCVAEDRIIALYTHPIALSKDQAKRARERQLEARKKSVPLSIETQDVLAGYHDLVSRHQSFVERILKSLGRSGCLARMLDNYEALRRVRAEISYEATSEDWKASLAGDPIPKVLSRGAAGHDAKTDPNRYLLWAPIGWQLFPYAAKQEDYEVVRVGKYFYATLAVQTPPREPEPFDALLARMPRTVPWRYTVRLAGGGELGLGTKKFFAKVLGIAGDNRAIAEAIEDIQTLEPGEAIKLRIQFTTWAENQDVLRERVAILERAVQGWGMTEPRLEAGDPVAGWVSGLPGVTHKSIAPVASAKLADVVPMLPWGRVASHWSQSPVAFRTPDGLLWPYLPGSSLQTNWVSVIFAPPGYGKSVLLNVLNMSSVLLPTLKRLPRISVIDIGPSSAGLISSLQNRLPPRMRHAVLYKKLQMIPEHAFNPFDTQLGLRKPSPTDRSFLVNFLSIVAQPAEREKPYENTSALIGMAIDEVFKYLDADMPHKYASGIHADVDAAIERLGLTLDAETTWWEVVDALFDRGAIREAKIAQRYAVPLIQDLVAMLTQSAAIEQVYGDIQTDTGETLVKAVRRMLSAAIREYPIFAKPTQLDLSSARIISLNLEDVAPKGGTAARRQSAIMYMLARQMLARDFFLDEDFVSFVPERYKVHHAKVIRELREDVKRLVYDELHRAGGLDQVLDQLEQDTREVRKRNLQIDLSSQNLADFHARLMANARTIMVLGAGQDDDVDAICKKFGFGDSERYCLQRYLNGPDEGGSNMLIKYYTKVGAYTQMVTLTLGSKEIWSYSTTTEDTLLREALTRKIGYVAAIETLANYFPTGSAKKEIERRGVAQGDRGLRLGEVDQSLIDTITDELVDAHNKSKLSKA